MTDYQDFPDVEAVVAKAIRDAATGAGTRVYSSVPKTPTYPLVTVSRQGGQPAVRRYLDAAEIEIYVWGTSKSEARDIADAARRAVLDLEGTAVTDPVSAFVSGVEDSRGLTWDPDQTTGRDRYFFTMSVYARAA